MTDIRTFVLGAGFSASQGYPLVKNLKQLVLDFIQVNQDPSYSVFLEPGNGDFAEGQFYAGLKQTDPDGTLQFEELLPSLNDALRATDSWDPKFITRKEWLRPIVMADQRIERQAARLLQRLL